MKTQYAHKRRKYWIDNEFQGRFLMAILKVEFLILGLSTILPFLLAFILYLPSSAETLNLPLIIFAIFLVTVITTVCIVYMSVHLSHRIAGPMYRIKIALESMKQGEKPKRITLRKGDQLQELANLFNEVFDLIETPESKPAIQPSGLHSQAAQESCAAVL